jgi:DNA-binding NarL/FixJ family response regulator
MRCLLVDDSRDFLGSAAPFLESQGVQVAGWATDASEALALAASANADVALVDIYLGDDDGIALVAELRKVAPSTAVILISTHDGDEIAELLPACGAVGFLRKDSLTVAAIERLVNR